MRRLKSSRLVLGAYQFFFVAAWLGSASHLSATLDRVGGENWYGNIAIPKEKIRDR